MSSYKNRNQIRQRSREPLDRRMDKWIQTGKQVVDGVAGNRPGQRRGGGWHDKETSANFEKVGRWVEEKIDWFFEDDDEWLDNQDLDYESPSESTSNIKRPLSAISLRVPKALPPHIDSIRDNSDELDNWPDEQSFKLNKWERKDKSIKQNSPDFNDSSLFERTPQRRKNIPRSSRRRY